MVLDIGRRSAVVKYFQHQPVAQVDKEQGLCEETRLRLVLNVLPTPGLLGLVCICSPESLKYRAQLLPVIQVFLDSPGYQ